jgi:hypothetical protein
MFKNRIEKMIKKMVEAEVRARLVVAEDSLNKEVQEIQMQIDRWIAEQARLAENTRKEFEKVRDHNHLHTQVVESYIQVQNKILIELREAVVALKKDKKVLNG